MTSETEQNAAALAAEAWRDLEIVANGAERLEVVMVHLPIDKVRALVAERSALPGHAADEGEAVAWTQPGCLTVVAAGGAMLAASSLTDGGREALNVEEAK